MRVFKSVLWQWWRIWRARCTNSGWGPWVSSVQREELRGGSSPESVGTLEQAPQGTGHGSKLLEFRRHMDNTLRWRVWVLGAPVRNQELDLDDPWSFLPIWCSMILWIYEKHSLHIYKLELCSYYKENTTFRALLLFSWGKLFKGTKMSCLGLLILSW